MEGVSLKTADLPTLLGVMQFLEAVFTEEARALWSEVIVAGHPGGAEDVADMALSSPATMLEDETRIVLDALAVCAVKKSVCGGGRHEKYSANNAMCPHCEMHHVLMTSACVRCRACK